MKRAILLVLLLGGCFDYDATSSLDGPTPQGDASSRPGVDGSAGTDASLGPDASTFGGPTIVDFSVGVATSSGWTAQYPSNAMHGDLIVLAAWFPQTGVTAPSDFTVLATPTDTSVSNTSAFIAYKIETVAEEQGEEPILVTPPVAQPSGAAMYVFAIRNATQIDLVGTPGTYSDTSSSQTVPVVPFANGGTQAVVIMGMHASPSCIFQSIAGFSPPVSTFNLDLYIDESANGLPIDGLCADALPSYVATVVSFS